MLKEIRPAIVLSPPSPSSRALPLPSGHDRYCRGRIFPRQAYGSLIEKDGKVIGSELMGHISPPTATSTAGPRPRSGPDPTDPSKTVSAPYNAANSTGSNLGPTNQALIDRVEGARKLKAENTGAVVPVDLVTTSASGLDPHISPEAALFQAPRVARVRGLPEEQVRALVADHVEGRLAGLWGEPRVNVLALNLALERHRTKMKFEARL